MLTDRIFVHPRTMWFLAVACTAASGIAQTGRTMYEPAPPVAGYTAVFSMQYPPAAVGRLNFFWITTRFPFALTVPIPGFTSHGSLRVDPINVLGNAFTLLDASLVTQLALSIPNIPTAVGFEFDVQTSDFDLVAADLAWADNDIEATVAPAIVQLVINEVDYDQPGTDTASFVEIYNAGNVIMNLSTIELRCVNGATSTQYGAYQLSGAPSLLPGEYLVIGNATVSVPPGVAFFVVNGDFLQNGAPDGLALVDTSTQQVLDALSYEGSITAALLVGWPGPVSLVEGTPFSGADSGAVPMSLARFPNGSDTNNAATDWTLATVPTPGSPN